MNLCKYTPASGLVAYVDGQPVYQERDCRAMIEVMLGALTGLASGDGVTLGKATFKGQRDVAVVINEASQFFYEGTR